LTPSHHPQQETLALLAAGGLGAGPRLVVETHLAGCAACRADVRAFEAVGGALLESQTPSEPAPDLLSCTLARLDAASVLSPAADTAPLPAPPGLADIPEALRRYPISPWRFIQPGLRWSRVTIPEDPQANVILLKVGAGRKVPQHGHDGAEYTQVLSGRFSDELGHYGPGDCIEADTDVDHQPVVDEDGECVCLAAVEGHLRLRGFVARLLQPFMGL
jgi:putative transcriptional regulator